MKNIFQNQNIFVDILINFNAAIDPKVFSKDSNVQILPDFENFPISEWEKQINVGLTGAFQCSQVFGSKMAERKQGE